MKRFLRLAFLSGLSAAAVASAAGAATISGEGPVGFPAATITRAPDLNQRIVLSGNTRPEARAENDRGAVADSLSLAHLQLQLKRSPEREAALTKYLADLQDTGSPNFHQWLTPEQFAAHYGVASADLAAVTSWLTRQGFAINGITPSGLNIDFTATAGQIRAAFRTEIHRLNVNGVAHFANMSDPQIPAALSSAVAGVVALHDFQPKPHFKQRVANPMYTFTNTNGTFTAITPGDLATIYNLKPLFAAGITGLGQTIMVLEDSYVYTVDDFTVFRKTFGLTRSYPHGSLTQVSPQGAMACTNPGYQGPGTPGYGTDNESILDVEWASAAAPNASIVLAACTAQSGIFGGLIALQNVLNGPAANLPTVVSISWGQAESISGATYNLSFLNAYQQAVAEGVSIFVSTGDADAAVADAGYDVAYSGITVSGFASTPYNVAVGGTDFGFNVNRIASSTYFSATNSNTYASALSYVQEIPWNDSCASALIANYYGMTPLAFCNSSNDPQFFGTFPNYGGSGGPSACATGTASSESNAVSGTCAGYNKPSWQSVYGNPADGVRDIPDVSLFAADGTWGSYYVVCLSNPIYYARCSGAPNTWYGGGGTSFSTPVMAGIQALVNQYTGSRWSNPNINYYYMARLEYGATGSPACNSNTVNKVSTNCVFYDITQGDNVGACLGYTDDGVVFYYNNCYTSSQYVSSPFGFPISVGVLSTSNTAYQPAYSATTGWDFSTGIGSVNAYNLVMHWASPPPAASR